MGEITMVNPISLSIRQTGAQIGTAVDNRVDTGCQVLSLQVKRGSHVGLVGATKSGKSGGLRELVSRLKADIDLNSKMVGFGWEMVQWTIGNLRFFWRSFSFDSEATPKSPFESTAKVNSIGRFGWRYRKTIFAFWGFWRYKKQRSFFLIFGIHLNTFELFELCTKNNQLARLSKRSLGWRLRWWHLTLWQVSFFFNQTDFFLFGRCRATPGPLDFFKYMFVWKRRYMPLSTKPTKPTDGCFFWCLKDFSRSMYPALGKSPGWPMLLKKHHSWPLAVFEKMCFVEDHGILKGANAYDFFVIWGCHRLPQPSCFHTWEMVNCIWTGMSKHWLHLRSRRTVIKRYNKPEKSERATSYKVSEILWIHCTWFLLTRSWWSQWKSVSPFPQGFAPAPRWWQQFGRGTFYQRSWCYATGKSPFCWGWDHTDEIKIKT